MLESQKNKRMHAFTVEIEWIAKEQGASNLLRMWNRNEQNYKQHFKPSSQNCWFFFFPTVERKENNTVKVTGMNHWR